MPVWGRFYTLFSSLFEISEYYGRNRNPAALQNAQVSINLRFPYWADISYWVRFISCSHTRSPSPHITSSAKEIWEGGLTLFLHTPPAPCIPPRRASSLGRAPGPVTAAGRGGWSRATASSSSRSPSGIRGLGVTRARGSSAACGQCLPRWPGRRKRSCPGTCCAWSSCKGVWMHKLKKN